MNETVLAEIRDYGDLHKCLRQVAVDREITREGIDAVAGLQPGYAGKLLSPVPMKRLGPASMGAVFGALGVKLFAVVDDEAVAKYRSQVDANKRVRPLHELRPEIPEHVKQLVEDELRKKRRKWGRNGGRKWQASLSPKERKRRASIGGRGWWASLSPDERRRTLARLSSARKTKRAKIERGK